MVDAVITLTDRCTMPVHSGEDNKPSLLFIASPINLLVRSSGVPRSFLPISRRRGWRSSLVARRSRMIQCVLPAYILCRLMVGRSSQSGIYIFIVKAEFLIMSVKFLATNPYVRRPISERSPDKI